MASALILAAGFGTRLRPLTSELPKPAVPVGDRPLLAHVAAACRRAGAQKLVANAHHEHAKLAAVIGRLQLGIDVVVEPEIRGTAGGVAGARQELGPGAVLVWNGDILTDAPAKALLELATEKDAQVLAVAPRPAGQGTVGMDEQGAVVRLRGQVFAPETRSGDYIGVMALGPSIVAELPANGCLVGDVALPHLAAGRKVWTVASSVPWSDLGDLNEYVAANFAWLTAQGADSWIGEGTEIAPGVSVQHSLIGVGAKLIGAGKLTDVIAWPGAEVVAPLSRAIVLGSGLVVPFDAPAKN